MSRTVCKNHHQFSNSGKYNDRYAKYHNQRQYNSNFNGECYRNDSRQHNGNSDFNSHGGFDNRNLNTDHSTCSDRNRSCYPGSNANSGKNAKETGNLDYPVGYVNVGRRLTSSGQYDYCLAVNQCSYRAGEKTVNTKMALISVNDIRILIDFLLEPGAYPKPGVFRNMAEYSSGMCGLMSPLMKPIILFALIFSISIPVASAWGVEKITIDPSGSVNTNSTVTALCSVGFPSGISADTFPSMNDLVMTTDLTDPKWNYTLILGGVENLRNPVTGQMLDLSGFELSYPSRVNESVRVTLMGTVPTTVLSGNMVILSVHEIDENGSINTSGEVIRTAAIKNYNQAIQTTSVPITTVANASDTTTPPIPSNAVVTTNITSAITANVTASTTTVNVTPTQTTILNDTATNLPSKTAIFTTVANPTVTAASVVTTAQISATPAQITQQALPETEVITLNPTPLPVKTLKKPVPQVTLGDMSTPAAGSPLQDSTIIASLVIGAVIVLVQRR